MELIKWFPTILAETLSQKRLILILFALKNFPLDIRILIIECCLSYDKFYSDNSSSSESDSELSYNEDYYNQMLQFLNFA